MLNQTSDFLHEDVALTNSLEPISVMACLSSYGAAALPQCRKGAEDGAG